MRITFPRVVSVRRMDPNRFSVGDEAVVEFGPGLLDFLLLKDREDRAVGDGLAAEWTIPVAAAVDAMYAVMFPAGREDLNQFTGVSHTATRIRAVRPGETLLGRARLEKLGGTLRFGYDVVSREHGDRLMNGTYSFVSIGPQGAKFYNPRLYPSPPPGEQRPEQPSMAAPAPPAATVLPPVRRGIADALLPREAARAARIVYWHWLSRREARSPMHFAKGLQQALRDPHIHGFSNRSATRPGRLLDWVIPDAVAGKLRSRGRKRTSSHPSAAVEHLRFLTSPTHLSPGSKATVRIEVGNPTELPANLRVEATEPFGFGLGFAWDGSTTVRLEPHQTEILSGTVTAQRPDEVNLGKPWPLRFTVWNGSMDLSTSAIHVAVPDESPPQLFYVLTEDCETFDGGGLTGDYGAARVLGNHNDFMDPEDYRVQMIEKPNALNSIAEKHGAFWTHFWTVPQRYAAIWASRQSTTGAWDDIVRDLDESVRQGSRRHEYAPHIHFDFEPDSRLPPQPRLRFDPGTDGFLPNDYYNPKTNPDHQYHGWDGARKGIAYVRREGDLASLDSKKGSLRKAIRYLAGLSVTGVPTLTTRTGAADFGEPPFDLETSTRSLLDNGLLANSDSAVYFTPKPEPRGRQLYFCRKDDLDREIEDLTQARLVQLRAPQKQLEPGTLEELNAWFDQRVRESRGPGIRAIVAMTHAMFVKGAPDPFRDTSGGDFQKLDDHLAYVRKTYPGIRFATASDAVLEFLDYYTPTPRAVMCRPRARSLDGKVHIYPIRILGRTIPIAETRPFRLEVLAPPLFEPDQVARLSVLYRGTPVATRHAPFGFDRLPAIEFDAVAFADYDLEIVTVDPAGRSLSDLGDDSPFRDSPSVLYDELPEMGRPDILRLDSPLLLQGPRPASVPQPGDEWVWRFPGDLFRILINPMGAGTHPVGRRFHPYAMISEGAALYCAQKACGDSWRPSGSEIRVLRPLRGTADFQVALKLESASDTRREFSAAFREAGTVAAEARIDFRCETGDRG